MLGLSNGLLYRNKIKETTPVFDPNVIQTDNNQGSACQAWYDFTDPSVVFKDNGGLSNVSVNENIGRINNKAQGIRPVGWFLRGNWTQAGGDGNSLNPTFKLDGVNNYSYANFDSSALSGFGQGLSASDYYSFPFGSSKGHGGGAYLFDYSSNPNPFSYVEGGYYPPFQNNGEASPNNNWFSLWNFETHDTTIFWVIKPSTADPAGFNQQTHWMFRPDINDDPGAVGRLQETYVEAFTSSSDDEFGVRYNREQEGPSGTVHISKGGDVTDGVNVLFCSFDNGSMFLSQNGSGAIDTATGITQISHNMRTGMMAIGQWPLGNVHSGVVTGSAYDGHFYELIIYNKALSSTEISTVLGALINKYN